MTALWLLDMDVDRVACVVMITSQSGNPFHMVYM